MRTKFLTLCLLMLVLLGCTTRAENINLDTKDLYEPGVIVNDKTIYETFVDGATRLYESGKYVTLAKLAGQLMEVGNFKKLDIQPVENTEVSYAELKKSTLVVGLLYNDDNSQGMNLSLATAFVIDKSGICVTNYHVFEKLGTPARGNLLLTTMDCNGQILPIEKIICASKENDLAVFKIKKGETELSPLKLSSQNVEPGEELSLISHPVGNFYVYTKGHATRYYESDENKTLRLATSVKFAVNSSGGAILNSKGEVAAVVSLTEPYFGGSGNQRMIQMVNYETIPVSTLRKMVGLDE